MKSVISPDQSILKDANDELLDGKVHSKRIKELKNSDKYKEKYSSLEPITVNFRPLMVKIKYPDCSSGTHRPIDYLLHEIMRLINQTHLNTNHLETEFVNFITSESFQRVQDRLKPGLISLGKKSP